jgi:hypothetical protein
MGFSWWVNKLPGAPKVQSEKFPAWDAAAGYDIIHL